MSIIQSINNAVRKKAAGGWKRWPQLFWAIDLHDTIIKATYQNDSKMDFYPNAERVLRLLSQRTDMMLILWTGTHKEQLDKYIDKLRDLGIVFDSVNENAHCMNDELRQTTDKLYFDILLDDKAGFDPMNDWHMIEIALITLVLWHTKYE